MPVLENLLQVASYDGPGYAPVVDFGAWRVALMNRGDGCAPGSIARVERHNETDEVFVLLEGRAMLFIAEAGEAGADVGRIHPCALEPSRLYNVRRAAWHACALSADAKVLIVESRDTSKANSDYVGLDDSQRADVARACASLDG